MASNSKHIVLATIGSLGDLHPMIALALELKRRGHRATILTIEFYRWKIEELGLEFQPIRPDMSPEDPELMRHIMDLKKGPEFIIRQLFMPSLRQMYDDLAAAARDADFIVSSELVFATQILAEAVARLNRRAVLLIGKNTPPANLPANIAAFDYAPFSEVLPRAACVVHQGGVGTTAQVLRAGVPLEATFETARLKGYEKLFAYVRAGNIAALATVVLWWAGVHSRKKYARRRAAKDGNPMDIDDVAVDFPAMPIMTAQPSFPGQDEAISVCLRKPQVYIDLSGWSLKYFSPTLAQDANTLLKHTALFDSDYPLVAQDRWPEDFDKIAIRDNVRPLILKENAMRLFGLA